MIKDTNDTVLPNEYFSHTQNARFEDNAAKKVLGQDQVFGTPTVAPYFALNWSTGANNYWFYAGSAKIYRYNGSSHEDFTRTSGGDYSTNLTASGNWTGSVFNGLAILNNGVDDPQCLATTGASKFTDLTLVCAALGKNSESDLLEAQTKIQLSGFKNISYVVMQQYLPPLGPQLIESIKKRMVKFPKTQKKLLNLISSQQWLFHCP